MSDNKANTIDIVSLDKDSLNYLLKNINICIY